MRKQPRSVASRPSPKSAKPGKVLRRAIDKSEIKEPPTVGKPVIEEPAQDQEGGDIDHGRAQNGTQRD